MTPTDEQLDAFASWERQSWETHAASYAACIADLTWGAAGALLDAVEITADTALLDVATGPGVVALAARTRGAEVIAVDQSAAMVGLARSAGLDACQARADRLPFATGAFDAVVAGFLINHLPRPVEAVAEFARVSKARVAVSVWDLPAVNPALGLFGAAAQSFDIADSVPPGPDSSLYADDGRLAALLVAAGLVDIRIARVGWALTVAPGAWFDARRGHATNGHGSRRSLGSAAGRPPEPLRGGGERLVRGRGWSGHAAGGGGDRQRGGSAPRRGPGGHGRSRPGAA